MPVLYLHVGHSKTGTSWLQAALRENPAALAKAGLGYSAAFGGGQEQGAEIGQGNGLSLAILPAEQWEAGLRMIDKTACPAGAVLSSEEFFPRLGQFAGPDALSSAALAAGFQRVEILLFIRNPVAHAASLWQQYLKRGGGSAPVSEFFLKYSVPERVSLFLDKFDSVRRIGLTCLNYDRHRGNMLAPLCAWLGLPVKALAPPAANTINRGMTRAELALQSALNCRIGKAGRILSDALCVGLPDLAPDRIIPDVECQREMCERLAATLESVNKCLPEAERYRHDIHPPSNAADSGAMCFNPEQIELIGSALGGEIHRLKRAIEHERQRKRIGF